ncbi:MAG: KEOPS complex subunit Cgi121 [Methanoregulaceae archaeon]|jgi:KEOPS complex subunit Cgi121
MNQCCIRNFRITIHDRDAFLQLVRDLSQRQGVHIILFDADQMAGQAHAESAIAHAFRAFEQGHQISNSVEMEALLYAAGSRQCIQGARFGVHPGINRTYLCICPPNQGVWEEVQKSGEDCSDENWELCSDEKISLLKEIFGITEEEIAIVGTERLQDLVLERVALLEVYR